MKLDVLLAENDMTVGVDLGENDMTFGVDLGETTTLYDGQNGATFTPSVSEAGVISWVNDRELPNPAPVNIKGPPGEPGKNGQDYVLTDADKTEIAEQAADLIDVPGGGGAGIDVSAAAPGQIIAVKAVDSKGKPTEWEAVDRECWTEKSGSTVILTERTLKVDSDEGAAYVADPVPDLVEGDRYTVKWNDTEYICTAQTVSADGTTGTALGNIGAMGLGADTGEPFVIAHFGAQAAAMGMYLIILPLDGSTSPTVAITGKLSKVHKLDNKYLDLAWLPKTENGATLLEEKPVAHGASPEINPTAVTEGQVLAVQYDGRRYECTVGKVEGILFLGNLAAAGLEPNTGEPFLIIIGGGVMFLDQGTHKLAIYDLNAPGTIYSKMPEGFSPHTEATEDRPGLMSPEDKKKLDGIAEGANKTTVATDFSSGDPVAGYIIQRALNTITEQTSKIPQIEKSLEGKAPAEHGHDVSEITGSAGQRVDGKVYEVDGTEVTAGRFAEVFNESCKAIGDHSHAEGLGTISSGVRAHSEGHGTTAGGDAAHSEGMETVAGGSCAHAEGFQTDALGNYSHAEGYSTTASGPGSHAEGYSTTASEIGAHAEGFGTKASAMGAHAEGRGTIANAAGQHVQGKYNIASPEYSHIVGNGTEAERSNAHTVSWGGDAWYRGEVYVGGESQSKGTRLAKVSEIPTDDHINELINTALGVIENGTY